LSMVFRVEATTQLTSPNFPLMPDETPEEFEAFRASIIGALKPKNAISEKLAEDMVWSYWEIHRLERWRSIMIQDNSAKFMLGEMDKDMSEELAVAISYRRAVIAVQYFEDRIEVLHRRARRIFLDYRTWQPKEARAAEDAVVNDK